MQTYKEKVPSFGKSEAPRLNKQNLTTPSLVCLEQRKEESQKILDKYPDKVPIICEKHSRSSLPESERSK